MDCWKQNIASGYMVLLQVVVVYDRGVTMFLLLLQLRQLPDAFHQELPWQKQHCAIFVINKDHPLSKDFVFPVVKCFAPLAVTTSARAQ